MIKTQIELPLEWHGRYLINTAMHQALGYVIFDKWQREWWACIITGNARMEHFVCTTKKAAQELVLEKVIQSLGRMLK